MLRFLLYSYHFQISRQFNCANTNECALKTNHSYLRTYCFEVHVSDEQEQEKELVELSSPRVRPIFRNYLILFFVLFPFFFFGALACVYVTSAYSKQIVPNHSTTWLTFDILLHMVSFFYCMGHVLLACAIFCIVMEMIRLRIRQFSLMVCECLCVEQKILIFVVHAKLVRKDRPFTEYFPTLVSHFLSIEARIEISSQQFQFMFSAITFFSFLALLVTMVSLFENPIAAIWLGFFFGAIFIVCSANLFIVLEY